MGIGNSTLNSRPSKAWWDAWPQPTSANEEQRARRADEFEEVEPEQEEPVPPVTVAQVHAFEEERERQWRAPDPAALPMRLPATAFQLWADMTRTVQHVRQASTPTRQIRSAPDGTSADEERAQPTAPTSPPSAPAGSEDNARVLPIQPDPNSLLPNDASSLSLNGTAALIPAQGVTKRADNPGLQNQDIDFFLAVGNQVSQAQHGRPMSPDEERKIRHAVAAVLDHGKAERGPDNKGTRYIVTDAFDRPLERYGQRIVDHLSEPPGGKLFKRTGQALQNPVTEYWLVIGNLITQVLHGRPLSSKEENIIRVAGSVPDTALDILYPPAMAGNLAGTGLQAAGMAIDGDPITPESMMGMIQNLNLRGLERGLDKPVVVNPGRPPLAAERPPLGSYQVELRGPLPQPDRRGMRTIDGIRYVEMEGAQYPIQRTGQRHQWKIYQPEGDPKQTGILVHYNRRIGEWQEHVPSQDPAETSVHQEAGWSPKPDTPAAAPEFQFHYRDAAWVTGAREFTLGGVPYAHEQRLGRYYRKVRVNAETADAGTLTLEVLTEPVSMPDGTTRWQVVGKDGKQLPEHISFSEDSKAEGVLKLDQPASEVSRWASWSPQPDTPSADPEFQFHYQNAAWVKGLPEFSHEGIPYAYLRDPGRYYRKVTVRFATADAHTVEFPVLTDAVARPDGTSRFQVIGKDGKQLSGYVSLFQGRKNDGVLESDRPVPAADQWTAWSPKPDTPAAEPEFQLHYRNPEWAARTHEFTSEDGVPYAYVPHLRQNYRKVRVQCETADAGTIKLDVLTQPVAMPDGTLRWQVVGRDGNNLPEHVLFSAGRKDEGVLELDQPEEAADPDAFRYVPPHDFQERQTILKDYAVRPEQPLSEPDSAGIRSSDGADYIQMDGEYYLVDRAPHDPTLRIYKPDWPQGWRVPVRQNAQGEWESFSLKLQGGSPVDDDMAELWHFPEHQRLPEFKRVVDAAGALAPEQRDVRLIALTRQIKHLPQNQRCVAFELLSGAPGMRNEARLTALAEQIRHLTTDERLIQFNVLFELTGNLPAGHPAALTEQIEHLTPEQRWHAFDRLLGAAGALDPQYRGAHLETLAGQLRWLHKKEILDRFAAIFRKITWLPNEEQRVRPLKALIQQIENLPGSVRRRVYRRTYSAADKLGPGGESSIALLKEWQDKILKQSLMEYEMLRDQPEAERFRRSNSAQPASLQLQRETFRPEQFALPGTALQAIQGLAVYGSTNPAEAAAAVTDRQRDGAHIGVWLAALMNPYPRAAAAPLKAYLELVNALHASGHLTSEETQSLLLPESKRERHLPISAAVASHWQSGVARPFVSTLANSMPENGEEQVTSRLSLAQSDQHHPQMKMRHSANFYKQIKRGMENLSAGQQDTPALRLLAEHGLIPPQRELGRMVKKLPAAVPTAASPVRTLSEIVTNIDNVMPKVLQQEAEKQKQDAELEEARVMHQSHRQAAERAQAAGKSSPVAAVVAGFSSQLHTQGAVLRAQKRQHIEHQEQVQVDQRRLAVQARAVRRRLEGLQYQQKRDWALPGDLTALMHAGQAAGPARPSTDAGKETEHALSQESQRAGQREEQLREAQRAIGRRAAQEAADAAAERHYFDTRKILSHAPGTSTLPVPSDSAPTQTHGQRVAVAEYLDESGQPRTQVR